MLLELLGITFSFLLVWVYFNFKSAAGNAPPGPPSLPLIGHLYLVAWKYITTGGEKQVPYHSMKQLTDKYGPIASMNFGLLCTVVVDDFDYAKEVLSSDVWTDRHWDAWFSRKSWGHPYGILFSRGDEWKEMRRFILRTLRDFGFGKFKSQELVMTEELNELTSRLNTKIDQEGNVVAMKQFFTISVLNILWSMMTGSIFSHDDEKLKRFNHISSSLIQLTPIAGNPANAWPFLTPLLDGELVRMTNELQEYFRELLLERRAVGDYKNDQRDFVEVFLKEIDNHKGKSPNYYTDEQLITVLMDLFMAGSETTANTLEFAILYMILNPEIQAKVQAEIDSVIGSSRLPTAVDKSNMPYTEATLLEIQRFANVLPVDSRSAVEDTKLGGYDIKKGIPAIINLHSIHFSKNIWTNPESFDPTRFLDSTQKVVINSTKILPFGAGKRVCIGESMARLTLFTYFTTLLQRYKFSIVDGQAKPTVKPVLGFTLCPQPYSVQISQR